MRVCRVCARRVVNKQPHAVYCNSECAGKMAKIRSDAKRRALGKPIRQRGKQRRIDKKWCKWCGDDLKGSPRYEIDEFCSEPCLVEYHHDIGAGWVTDALHMTL